MVSVFKAYTLYNELFFDYKHVQKTNPVVPPTNYWAM